MDPLALGGEDSIRNVVYVCDTCNFNKSDMPFLQWIDKLDDEHRDLSTAIYIEKHGHSPEEFKKGAPTLRTEGVFADLLLDEEELKMFYPVPIVTGPPEN